MENIIKTLRKNSKGQMRIIETILASFVIVGALTFANILAIIPSSSIYEPSELQRIGFNALHDLDDQSLLARFVYNQEWTNLGAALRVILPQDVFFNLTVYDLQGNRVNNVPIFFGDYASFASSKNTASITYGVTGNPSKLNGTSYQATLDPKTVTLQLIRG